MVPIWPRWSWHRSITAPMKSFGVMMSAATIGSTIFLILPSGEFARIGDAMHGIVFRGDLVRHVRRGGDQVKVEFAAQTFGDDLHVQ